SPSSVMPQKKNPDILELTRGKMNRYKLKDNERKLQLVLVANVCKVALWFFDVVVLKIITPL
ncbi:MAG: hypothetical protein JRZ95_04105, partial [Nitrososphaerota archaeon]|nr:hypothetical protein [Nitrososphaerota archaeon]